MVEHYHTLFDVLSKHVLHCRYTYNLLILLTSFVVFKVVPLYNQ